jgi:transposase-like protein
MTENDENPNQSKGPGRPRGSDEVKKRCYRLYHIEGLTGKQVAKAMGIPRTTAVQYANEIHRQIARRP